MLRIAIFSLFWLTLVSSLHLEYRPPSDNASRTSLTTREESPIVCRWGTYDFQIGQEYNGLVCPGVYHRITDNDCEILYTDWTQTTCDSWCQARTHFYYGTEQPFTNPGYFVGPTQANISEDHFQFYRDKSDRISHKDLNVIDPGVRAFKIIHDLHVY